MEYRQNLAAERPETVIRPGRKKAGKSQRNGSGETQQITPGKIKELRQDVANLEAHLEVMKKQINALNALIRHFEK